MKRLLVVLLLVASWCAYAQQTISVSGDAEIKVVPDQAMLFLGVEVHAKALAESRQENDRRIASVRGAAAKLGVQEGDVQTDFIQLGMAYESDGITPRYFYSRKSMVLVVRKIDDMEKVLSAAVDAGVTHIHRVEFQTTKLRQYRDEARALAVKAATEKARDMAAVAGMKVAGGPISISAWQYGGGSSYGSGWGGNWGGGMQTMSQNVSIAGSGPETQGTIALGRISVTATVSLQFRIE